MNIQVPKQISKILSKIPSFKTKVVNSKEDITTKEEYSQYSQTLKHLRLFQDVQDRKTLECSLDKLLLAFKKSDLIFHNEFFAVVLKKEYLKHRQTLQSLTNDFTDLNGVKKIVEYSNKIKNISNDDFDLTEAIGNYLEVSNKKLHSNWTSSLKPIKNSTTDHDINLTSTDSLVNIGNQENEDNISTVSPTGVIDFAQRYESSKQNCILKP